MRPGPPYTQEQADQIVTDCTSAIHADLTTAGYPVQVVAEGLRIVFVHPFHGGELTARFDPLLGEWCSTFHDTDYRERRWKTSPYMIKAVTRRITELEQAKQKRDQERFQLERICSIMSRLAGVHCWDRMSGARYSLGSFDAMATVTHDMISVRSARIGISVDIPVTPQTFDAVISSKMNRAVTACRRLELDIEYAQDALNKLK